jgi:hypothetical protein
LAELGMDGGGLPEIIVKIQRLKKIEADCKNAKGWRSK